VLDYGCGIGSHVVAAAELVGESGKVYAVDIHPLAVRAVEKAAAKRGLRNLQALHTDRAVGLAGGSVDVVLLYDVLHHLAAPERVLGGLRRVLKPQGVLSVSDHHLRQDDIVGRVTSSGAFRLVERGKSTLKFAPI